MRLLVAILVLAASPAFADEQQEREMLRKMEEFTNGYCQCRAGDTKCAERVTAAMQKWAEGIAKTWQNTSKPTPDFTKRIQPIVERMTRCMTAAMTPPAKPPEKPPEKPEKPPEAPGTITMPELAKLLGGTWKCTGKSGGASGGKPVTGTVTVKLARDLDDAWLQYISVATSENVTHKNVAYVRVDPADKRWYHVGVDSAGMTHTSSSVGPVARKIVWTGEARSATTKLAVRHTDDISDAKQFKRLSEVSSDSGKTWTVVFESSCKR